MVRPLGRPRIHVPMTESTMDDARELAEGGAPHGFLVRADQQVGGRGRAGRGWASPRGGLWFSLLLRPERAPESWTLLALVAGSACASAMRRLGADARLKWPNDVLLGGRKAAGFLLESRVGEFVVLGAGVNVRVPREALPAEVQGIATSLHEHVERPVDADAFLEEFLEAFSSRYEAWSSGTLDEALCEEWTAFSETVGKKVRTEAGVEGVAVGVDARGALRVRRAEGPVTSVAWGDVLSVEAGPGQ